MLFGNEPNPGREVTSRSESTGVSNTRDQGGCQHRPDPGNVMKALARLVGPVPGHNHPIELQDLLLDTEQLSAERGRHARATSDTPLSLGSATICSSAVTPLRPPGATMPNSARCARIELITAICWRMNRWRVR